MIGWIIASIAGLFLVSRGSSNPGATAPVIKNATGGALTKTLGTQHKPPSYYATGNPGYETATASAPASVPKVVTRPIAVAKVPTRVFSSVPGTVVHVIPSQGTSAAPSYTPQRTRGVSTVPPKPVLSNFVNLRQVSRNTTAPELAQPFWSKTRRSLA